MRMEMNYSHGMKVMNGEINTSGPRRMVQTGGLEQHIGLTLMEMDTEHSQKEQQRWTSSQLYLQRLIPIMTAIQITGLP